MGGGLRNLTGKSRPQMPGKGVEREEGLGERKEPGSRGFLMGPEGPT